MNVGGFQIISEDLDTKSLARECAAEFIGTFFLIFIGCGGVYGAEAMNPDGLDSAAVLQIAFAFGIGIGGSVHLFSDISGGQFNPAVSLALFFAQEMSLLKVLIYTALQFGGGLLGAGVLYGMLDYCPGAVDLNPALPHKLPSGFFIEFFGTLFLVLTVLSTTNSNRSHQPSYLQPLSIGLAIFVLHMFLVPATGCGINPTRSAATNIVQGTVNDDFWIYIFGPLLASVVGGLLYKFLFNPHYIHRNKKPAAVPTVYKNNDAAFSMEP